MMVKVIQFEIFSFIIGVVMTLFSLWMGKLAANLHRRLDE